MLRRSADFARYRAPLHPLPPLPPQHVGPPLRVGETCLLRRPDEWFDVIVQLRGVDKDLALVLVLVQDQLERVPLNCLRRHQKCCFNAQQ
jgi:hypothetical protein